MIGMGDGKCPFVFNTDPATFKVGDNVSYRVPALGDFPFAAQIVAVHPDHIDIVNPAEPNTVLRATREGRPTVSDDQAMA